MREEEQGAAKGAAGGAAKGAAGRAAKGAARRGWRPQNRMLDVQILEEQGVTEGMGSSCKTKRMTKRRPKKKVRDPVLKWPAMQMLKRLK